MIFLETLASELRQRALQLRDRAGPDVEVLVRHRDGSLILRWESDKELVV